MTCCNCGAVGRCRRYRYALARRTTELCGDCAAILRGLGMDLRPA